MRKLLKYMLRVLSRALITKHRIDLVAVLNSEDNSLSRLHSIISPFFPIRIGSEHAIAEFTIPLMILDIQAYPANLWEWVRVLVGTIIRLLIFKPYPHVLIVEFDTVNQELRDYWLQALAPAMVLDLAELNEEHAMNQVVEFFDLDPEIVSNIRGDNDFAPPRIRNLTHESGAQIWVSTHTYSPAPLTAVLELIEPGSKRQIIFTKNHTDYQIVSELKGWQINPIKVKLRADDLVVIRTHHLRVAEVLEKLV